MDALVNTSGLVCGYGGTSVLQDVTFTLVPGDRVAVLGPNVNGPEANRFFQSLKLK